MSTSSIKIGAIISYKKGKYGGGNKNVEKILQKQRKKQIQSVSVPQWSKEDEKIIKKHSKITSSLGKLMQIVIVHQILSQKGIYEYNLPTCKMSGRLSLDFFFPFFLKKKRVIPDFFLHLYLNKNLRFPV